MTITLTTADLEELFAQAQQQPDFCPQTAVELQTHLPQKFGEGGDRIIRLRGGLEILIRDARLRQNIRIEQQHESVFPLTAKFYLAGSSRVQTPGLSGSQADYEEVAGCNYLYYLPNLAEVEEWQANEWTQIVMIYANPDYFRLFHWQDELLPEPLKQAILGIARPFHQSLGQTTPAMHQALQQILHCPYSGLTRQLYLEGKALELLTLQLAHWKAEESPSKPKTLRSDEVERLHHAREILIQQSAEPPSLRELARQVGLNDRKLKQGFRCLFNTTVFGYLQEHRMQQAKQLLHQPNLTIAAVAARVGYRNPEAFSTAFRRKFSISPKAYQLDRPT